jgi:hypothetical protein
MAQNIPPIPPAEIVAGSIVRLISGGPLMTVEAIGRPDDQVSTVYFEHITVVGDGCGSSLEWVIKRNTFRRAALQDAHWMMRRAIAEVGPLTDEGEAYEHELAQIAARLPAAQTGGEL